MEMSQEFTTPICALFERSVVVTTVLKRFVVGVIGSLAIDGKVTF